MPSLPAASRARTSVAVAAAIAFVAVGASAQSTSPRKVIGIADYARWRAIEGAQISADGQWVASTFRLTNVLPDESKPELHLRSLATDQETVIAHASNGAFSRDSRWLVYQVDSVPVRGAGRGGRGAGGAPAAQAPGGGAAAGGGANGAATIRRYELRDLATGATRAWSDIGSATFNASTTHLLLRRQGGGAGAGRGGRGGGFGGGAGAGGGDAGASSAAPRGADVLLIDLATGRSQFIGSVGDIAFNRTGELLAYTVDAAASDANGLFVLDLATGRLHALDNDARRYSRITWAADGRGLAVLKGDAVPGRRERVNVALAFADVREALANPRVAPVVFDPSHAAGWEPGAVLSERAPLAWSLDKQRIFFGSKAQVAAQDTGRKPGTDSIADVDVWRTNDTRIQSAQIVRAPQEQNFTYRQAFDVASGRYIHLADTTMREMDVSLDGKWAVGRDQRAYVSDWKPPQADLYRVNTATGERTLLLKGHVTANGGVVGISPDGRNFLYWKDNRYQVYDLDAGTSRTIGAGAPSFVDTDDDHTGPRPHFPVVAWTPDGSAVIVQSKFDVWLLPVDGSAGRNLTMGFGARSDVRYTVVRTQQVDDADPLAARHQRELDPTQPIVLATFGEYTKKAGFSRLENGRVTEIVFDDAAYGIPQRAQNAERFLFTRQTYSDFPDLRVSGANFADARKITDANPQQSEYRWIGKRVLIDYKDKDGHRLQGFLSLPEDWKPGTRLPMIVNFYEKFSQDLNRYPAPVYMSGVRVPPVEAVSRGYITLLADIYYHTGSSHSDQLNAVEAATRRAIELGYADPKRIGVNGHSYGGEGSAFIATRSRMFAAVAMGAGVTDLFTDFSQSWGWSYQIAGGSGENGNQYYMQGQGRWGFSPWEKPDVYHFESALSHVPEVSQPVLIMHGTADPTVSFSEGMNFYNALRFNGKEAYLLAYPGEGHSLRGLANQKDLTTKYFEYFDRFLKNAPAPKWMADGVPYLAKIQGPQTAPGGTTP